MTIFSIQRSFFSCLLLNLLQPIETSTQIETFTHDCVPCSVTIDASVQMLSRFLLLSGLFIAAAVAQPHGMHKRSISSSSNNLDCVMCKALFTTQDGTADPQQAMRNFCNTALDSGSPDKVSPRQIKKHLVSRNDLNAEMFTCVSIIIVVLQDIFEKRNV